MKKLRVSGYNDYVAVDDVDEHGNSTCVIYLAKDKPVKCMVKAEPYECRKFGHVSYETSLLFDGKKITATEIDKRSYHEGMVYDLPFEELLSGHYCHFH